MFGLLIFMQLLASVPQVLNGSDLSNIFYNISLKITAAECHNDTNISNPISNHNIECFPLTSNLFVSFIDFNSSFIIMAFTLHFSSFKRSIWMTNIQTSTWWKLHWCCDCNWILCPTKILINFSYQLFIQAFCNSKNLTKKAPFHFVESLNFV